MDKQTDGHHTMTENNDHLFGQVKVCQLRGLLQASSGTLGLYKISEVSKFDIFAKSFHI